MKITLARLRYGLGKLSRGLGRRIALLQKSIREVPPRIAQTVRLRGYSSDTKRLILFLTPARDIVNGGILSISSLYTESQHLRDIHTSEVFLCTLPSEPTLTKYTQFNNSNWVFCMSQVLRHFKEIDSLIVHIPEIYINKFVADLTQRDLATVRRVKELHLNVMLQNFWYLKGQNIAGIKALGKTTCTTAHERYSTREIREHVGIPLHRLSVYVSPEQYRRASYEEKRELLIVSPDGHPMKKQVLEKISQRLPHLRIQIISGLTYEQFKETICNAKWALTFGEGLDGYFAESIFSGAIGFAVYNDDFFMPDFKTLETVYESYECLQERIVADILRLDSKDAYRNYQAIEFSLLAKYYHIDRYRENLRKFYRGEYTYP